MPEETPTFQAEKAASTWAHDNKTIMAPEGSVDAGRIADAGAATEMAYAEKPGRDAALGTQVEMQRQAETGLTDTERDNIEFMKGVKEKGGDGVIEMTDEKGREMMFLYPRENGTTGSVFISVLNRKGAFSMDLGALGYAEKYTSINWTAMNDAIDSMDLEKMDSHYSSIKVKIDQVVDDPATRENAQRGEIRVYKKDLSTAGGMDGFREELSAARARAEAAAAEKSKKVGLSAAEKLAML